jgi:hypothetical protein
VKKKEEKVGLITKKDKNQHISINQFGIPIFPDIGSWNIGQSNGKKVNTPIKTRINIIPITAIVSAL